MMTLIVVLGVLWLLGMITSYTAGGLIHLLLVVALIMFVVNLVSGRRRRYSAREMARAARWRQRKVEQTH